MKRSWRRAVMTIAGALAWVAVCRAAKAAPPVMVKDLNTTKNGASSDPRSFVAVGDVAFFTAWDTRHGRELWKTDGTRAGTVLAADLLSGPDAAEPDFSDDIALAAIGKTVFFAAHRADTGLELWRTDGELNGTRLVRDIRPGPDGSGAQQFTVVGDVLFFVADDGVHGQELWRSDGTTSGTELVVDLTQGPESSDIGAMTALGDALLFTASGGLWRTVGTAASTQLLKQLGEVGALYPTPRPGTLIEVNQGTASTHYVRAWTTDGTPEGTAPGKQWQWPYGGIIYAFDPFPSAMLGDTLIQVAPPEKCPPAFAVLWASSSASPSTFEEIACVEIFNDIVTAGDRAFFWGRNAGGSGLFALDASRKVSLIHQSPDIVSIGQLTPVGTELLFSEATADGSVWLWRSDGTPAGTQPIKESPSLGDSPFCALGSKALFSDDDGVVGREPWITDLTAEGTTVLRDIAEAEESSNPSFLTPADAWLFFLADDGVHGPAFWRTDGTPEKTTRTHLPKGGGPDPTSLAWTTSAGGTFYVAERVGNTGLRLWFVDVATNTFHDEPVTWELPAENSSPFFCVAGDSLYLVVGDGSKEGSTQTLWRSQGTRSTTVRVADAADPISGAEPSGSGLVLFTVSPDNVTTVWRTEGTRATPQSIGALDGATGFATSIDGRVFFTISSGADVGTWVVAPGAAEPARLSDIAFVAMDGAGATLFALSQIDEQTQELWKSDGTPGGTMRLQTLPQNSFGLSVVGSTAFFSVFLETTAGPLAQQLWSTDGTEKRTKLLVDSSEYLGFPVTVPGVGIVFFNHTPEYGREPWLSDGSKHGTRMLGDLAPGPLSSVGGMSTSQPAIVSGGRVFFVADDGTHGNELWTYVFAPPEPEPSSCSCSLFGEKRPGGGALVTAAAALLGLRRRRRRRSS